MRYALTVMDGIVKVVVEGPFEPSAVESMSLAILNEDVKGPFLPILIDAHNTDCGVAEPNIEEGLRIWEATARRRPLRIALLVDNDALFGIGRMAMALKEEPNLELRVFRDLVDSLRWLSRREHGESDQGTW